MAGLQSMTLTERMNDINSDGLQDYTFEEACNKYVKANISGYSSISLNKYTAEEAFTIIRNSIFDGISSELIEAANDIAFGGSNSWVAYDDSGADVSLNTTGGELVVTTQTDNEKEGAQLPVEDVGDGSDTSLVVGRTYRVSMDLTLTTPGSGTFSMIMGLGGVLSSAFDINTSKVTYIKDFLITDKTTSLKIYNTSATATVFNIDNVSVKQISEHDLTELINEMGPYEAHEYTATEALNKKNAIVESP